MKQAQFSPLQVEEQVCVIFAGVRGYLDKVAKARVQEFEKEFLRHLHADHAELLKAIRTEKALSEANEKKLISILDAFAKKFA